MNEMRITREKQHQLRGEASSSSSRDNSRHLRSREVLYFPDGSFLGIENNTCGYYLTEFNHSFGKAVSWLFEC
jgi:hypothetical protein